MLPEILTLIGDASHAERQREAQRAAYVEFLVRANAVLAISHPSAAPAGELRDLNRALDAMLLVGPADVVEAAQRLAALAHDDQQHSPSDVEQARNVFLNAARSQWASRLVTA